MANGGFAGQSSVGLETRRDDIRVALRRQVQRSSFFAVNDIGIAEQSVTGFLQHHIHLSEWARLEAGLRGDVYFFDARDHLPSQGADADFEAVRVSGNKTESIVSPKASLVLGPFYDSEVYLNFSSGFHSNDARSVLRTGRDGLVRALGSEVGMRTRQLDRLDLAAALWLIDSDSELTFSGDGGDVDADLVDGVYQAGPASRRWGVDFEARYEILAWLYADYDLSPKTSVGVEVNWTRASRRRQNPSIRFATQEAAPQRERLLGSANKLSVRPEERPSVQAASRRPSQVPL